MGRSVKIASVVQNQWALDFEGNEQRILRGIAEAKAAGARLRIGSELEIPGYGCEDHFLESDTFLHSWQVLASILADPNCYEILLLIGMPVMHKNTGYNCVVAILNGKIVLIRPKTALCDDANYREGRWFVPWRKERETEDFHLPRMIRKVTGQVTVPFGDAVIALEDTVVGCETCEELWTTQSPHVAMALDGVEIFCNASGSHTELRKSLYQLNTLIQGAVYKVGGIYAFSNQRGCDGGRLFYDGNATIAINGQVMARSSQFSLREVEVVTATLDLEEVRAYRNSIRSGRQQASLAPSYPRVRVDFALSSTDPPINIPILKRLEVVLPTPEEEIAFGPACWLWDYLRRSRQGGFFVPLSGGRDSAAVVCLVYSMARMVARAVKDGDSQVTADIKRILSIQEDDEEDLTDPKLICKKLLFTAYLGTENSSKATKKRAHDLATQIGADHTSLVIDLAVAAVIKIFNLSTGFLPVYSVHGGEARENLALQNVQARLRMVISYLFAQLNLWVRGRPGGLLVLATGNVDEGLRGYLTKYDCSSGDINPIGSINKMDLVRFLRYAMANWGLSSLTEILEAAPTAELEPLNEGECVQTDEADMGMSYKELAEFGRLRLPGRCGPYSMFGKLLTQWGDRLTPPEIAAKVKHFFRCYAINRHKATVGTPSYHAESYSPDDNRHDHRPFLYNTAWPFQFALIDQQVRELEK